jgi:hypothetical protein
MLIRSNVVRGNPLTYCREILMKTCNLQMAVDIDQQKQAHHIFNLKGGLINNLLIASIGGIPWYIKVPGEYIQYTVTKGCLINHE